MRVELPDRAVQVNATMPEDPLPAVGRYAQRMGCTRSGLLAQAVRERLQQEGEASQD